MNRERPVPTWRGLVRHKGMLIVFFGPVGVGKSTITRLLTYALNALGIKVHRIFLKAFHGLSCALWVSTAKLLALPREHAMEHALWRSV